MPPLRGTLAAIVSVLIVVTVALADENLDDLDTSAASPLSSSISGKEDPLQSILPKVKFICKGRAEGYYADIDFDCEVFHYCKTNGFRFTFVCPPNSKFNQRQMTCDYEAKDNACSELSGSATSGKKSKSASKQTSHLPSDTSNVKQSNSLVTQTTTQSNLVGTSSAVENNLNQPKAPVEEEDEEPVDNTTRKQSSSSSPTTEAIQYNGNTFDLLGSGNSAHSSRKQQWPYLIPTTTPSSNPTATSTATVTILPFTTVSPFVKDELNDVHSERHRGKIDAIVANATEINWEVTSNTPSSFSLNALNEIESIGGKSGSDRLTSSQGGNDGNEYYQFTGPRNPGDRYVAISSGGRETTTTSPAASDALPQPVYRRPGDDLTTTASSVTVPPFFSSAGLGEKTGQSGPSSGKEPSATGANKSASSEAPTTGTPRTSPSQVAFSTSSPVSINHSEVSTLRPFATSATGNGNVWPPSSLSSPSSPSSPPQSPSSAPHQQQSTDSGFQPSFKLLKSSPGHSRNTIKHASRIPASFNSLYHSGYDPTVPMIESLFSDAFSNGNRFHDLLLAASPVDSPLHPHPTASDPFKPLISSPGMKNSNNDTTSTSLQSFLASLALPNSGYSVHSPSSSSSASPSTGFIFEPLHLLPSMNADHSVNLNSIANGQPNHSKNSLLTDALSSIQSQFSPSNSFLSGSGSSGQHQQHQPHHQQQPPTQQSAAAAGLSKVFKFSQLLSSNPANHVKSPFEAVNNAPGTSVNSGKVPQQQQQQQQQQHHQQQQHLAPGSTRFIFTPSESNGNLAVSSSLQAVPSHQAQLTPIMTEFNQLPASIQNQVATQLGLSVPSKQSQVNLHLLPGSSSQSDDSTLTSNNESLDPSNKPFVPEGAFGLPKLNPSNHKPHIPLDEQPPTNNFHTQLPNLLPSSHLLALQSSLFPPPTSNNNNGPITSKSNQVKHHQQVHQQQMQQMQGQKQQVSPKHPMQASANSLNSLSSLGSLPHTNSLIGELNNLMRHNFFTRSRSPSMPHLSRLQISANYGNKQQQPPAASSPLSISGDHQMQGSNSLPVTPTAASSGPKFPPNPFTWLTKQLPKNPLESFNLMTSSSSQGSTYASFADPPSDSQHHQPPKRRRKIFDQITKLFNPQQQLPPALEQLIQEQQRASASESRRITSLLRSPLQSSSTKTELSIVKHIIEGLDKNGTNSGPIVPTAPSFLPLTLPKPTYMPQAITLASVFVDSNATLGERSGGPGSGPNGNSASIKSPQQPGHVQHPQMTLSRRHDDVPEEETEWIDSHPHSVRPFFDSVPNIHSLDQMSTPSPLPPGTGQFSQLITNDSFVPMVRHTVPRSKRQALFQMDNRAGGQMPPFGTPVHPAGTFPLLFPPSPHPQSEFGPIELNNIFDGPNDLLRSPFAGAKLPVKFSFGQESKIHNSISRFFPNRAHLQPLGDSPPPVMVPFLNNNNKVSPTMVKFADQGSSHMSPGPLNHLPNPFPTVPLETFDYESIKSAVEAVPLSSVLGPNGHGLGAMVQPHHMSLANHPHHPHHLSMGGHKHHHSSASPSAAPSNPSSKIVSSPTAAGLYASGALPSGTNNLLSTPFPPLKYDAKTGTFYEPLFGSHIPASLAMSDFPSSLFHQNYINSGAAPSSSSLSSPSSSSSSSSPSPDSPNKSIGPKYKFVPLKEPFSSSSGGGTASGSINHHSTQSISSRRPMYNQFPTPVPLPLKPTPVKSQSVANSLSHSSQPKASMVAYEYLFKPINYHSKPLASLPKRPPLRDRVPFAAVTEVSYEKVNFPAMKESNEPKVASNNANGHGKSFQVSGTSHSGQGNSAVIHGSGVVKEHTNKSDKKPQASSPMTSKATSSPLLYPVPVFAPDGSARIYHANYNGAHVKSSSSSNFGFLNHPKITYNEQLSSNKYSSSESQPKRPSAFNVSPTTFPSTGDAMSMVVTPLQKEIEDLINRNKDTNHTNLYKMPPPYQLEDVSDTSIFDKVPSPSQVESPVNHEDLSWPKHQFTKPIYSPADVPSLYERPESHRATLTNNYNPVYPESVSHFSKNRNHLTTPRPPKTLNVLVTGPPTQPPSYGQKLSMRLPQSVFTKIQEAKTTKKPIIDSPKNQVWWDEKSAHAKPPYSQTYAIESMQPKPTTATFATATTSHPIYIKNELKHANHLAPFKEWTELDKNSPTPVYRPEDEEEKPDYFESKDKVHSTGPKHVSYEYHGHTPEQNQDQGKFYHQNIPVYTEHPPTTTMATMTTTTMSPPSYEQQPPHQHKPLYDQNVEYYDNDVKGGNELDTHSINGESETLPPLVMEETTTPEPKRPSLFNKRPGHQSFVDRYKRPNQVSGSKNSLFIISSTTSLPTTSSTPFVQYSSTSTVSPSVTTSDENETPGVYGSRLNSGRTPVISVKASVSTSIKPSVTYPYQAKTTPAPAKSQRPSYGRYTPIASTTTSTTTTTTTTEAPMEYSDEDLEQVFKYPTTMRPVTTTTTTTPAPKSSPKLIKLRNRYSGYTSTTTSTTTSAPPTSATAATAASNNLFTGRLTSIRDLGLMDVEDPDEEESIITDDQGDAGQSGPYPAETSATAALIQTTTAIPPPSSTMEVITTPSAVKKVYSSSSGGSLNARLSLQRLKGLNFSTPKSRPDASQG